jgi:hypothetical protein
MGVFMETTLEKVLEDITTLKKCFEYFKEKNTSLSLELDIEKEHAKQLVDKINLLNDLCRVKDSLLRIAESKIKQLEEEHRGISCAFCGDLVGREFRLIQEHTKICDKHPLRDALQKIKQLESENKK